MVVMADLHSFFLFSTVSLLEKTSCYVLQQPVGNPHVKGPRPAKNYGSELGSKQVLSESSHEHEQQFERPRARP